MLVASKRRIQSSVPGSLVWFEMAETLGSSQRRARGIPLGLKSGEAGLGSDGDGEI